GDSLYVVPVHHAGDAGRTLYIPEGIWYSLWDDRPLGHAGQEVWIPTQLSHIPVFVRGGHLIPRWPVQQFVGELSSPPTSYELWWAPHAKECSYHYEDAGDGHGYRISQYLYHQFDYVSDAHSFELEHKTTGALEPLSERVECCLHGLPQGVHVSIWLDEQEVATGEFDAKGVLRFILPTRFKKLRLRF
ncbi:MAG: glycoside hydrolase family 31 protein, partial [Akkermansia sp.]